MFAADSTEVQIYICTSFLSLSVFAHLLSMSDGESRVSSLHAAGSDAPIWCSSHPLGHEAESIDDI